METNNANNKTIVNNYYYITFDNLKEWMNFANMAHLFQPIKQNFSMKCTKNEPKQSQENKIIINEEKTDHNELEIKEEKKTKNDDNNSQECSTNEISIEIKSPEANKIAHIFKIKKNYFITSDKKKTGRKPKNSTKNSVHTKYSHDNILRKLKVKFLHKIIQYINRKIQQIPDKKIKLLKPLKGMIAQDNTINFNKKLLHSKLKDIFSTYEINGKFKKFEKNYNKDIIDKIYTENIKELIDILDMTFLEVFNIFRDINETQKLSGLEKMDTVISEMETKDNNCEYINKFKDVANEFEKYYFNKVARK